MHSVPVLPSPRLDTTMPRPPRPAASVERETVVHEGRRSLREAMGAWKLKVATAGLWVLIALAGAGGLRALVWSAAPATSRTVASTPSGSSTVAGRRSPSGRPRQVPRSPSTRCRSVAP